MKYYLSICAIFRNEAAYLREWIEFHRLMGTEHFFLYNNLSDDNYLQVLKYYIERGIVTLEDWPRPWARGTQTNVYRDCLDRYGGESRWIAFIDLDEFLFAPHSETLKGALKEYEGVPGIVVNWQVYGTSGHKKKPAGLVIENFTMKAATGWIRNKRVKSIVDPSKTLRPVGGHVFEYLGGASAVTENMEPVKIVRTWRLGRLLKRLLIGVMPRLPVDPYAVNRSPVKRVSVDKLRINHYIVKSEEEVLDSMSYHWQHRRVNQMHWFKYHDRNDERDDILLSRVPELKKRLSAPD